MPRKSKKTVEEPVIEESKKITKRTIKIPSAIAENLRKVDTVSNPVQDVEENKTTLDTTIIKSSKTNEELNSTVEQTQEVKKVKRTLHLNIRKTANTNVEEKNVKISNEEPSTTVAKETAFLDDPYIYSTFEISTSKVEKSKNEPIVNLNSTFFYEPSVFEKYSIDITEADSSDTVVDLYDLNQNNEIIEEENVVDENNIQEETLVHKVPSLNDIISIDDESESIEDILNLNNDLDELFEISDTDNNENIVDDEIVEEYDEDYTSEDIVDDKIVEEYDKDYTSEDIVDDEIVEEYDEDYTSEDIVDDEIVEEYDEDYTSEDIVDDEIVEEYDEDYTSEDIIDENEDSLYEEIVNTDGSYIKNEDYNYEVTENSTISHIVNNIDFENDSIDETKENTYINIEDSDEEILKEAADNIDIPDTTTVGKLIGNSENTTSPLFNKQKTPVVSHVFKKFSYDEADTLNFENNVNNIMSTQEQNNLSDINQLLGSFETNGQKKVTELDVVAEPVGVTVPVIENDTELFNETSLSGNYNQENDSNILNILSPDTQSQEIDDLEYYEEDYNNVKEFDDTEYYEKCDNVEYYDEDYDNIPETNDVEYYDEKYDNITEIDGAEYEESNKQLGGIPINDISSLTKMFETFSETISTLSKRITELENKNTQTVVEKTNNTDTIKELENNNEIVNNVEELEDNNNTEIIDNVEELEDNNNTEIIDNVEELEDNNNTEIIDNVEELEENNNTKIINDIEDSFEENIIETIQKTKYAEKDFYDIDNTNTITETVDIVDNNIETTSNIEENVKGIVENSIVEDDPTSDFLRILDSLSQTIYDLENSSLDKETMENEFSAIDNLINNITPNNETISTDNIVTSDKELNTNTEIDEPKEKLFEIIEDGNSFDFSSFYKEHTTPKIENNETLYISEKTQKVYFPYTSDDIMEKLNDPLKNYSSPEEVIENEYIVPLSEFRKPVLSRFKEAYNFMRTKEKGSISESFDLALELMFHSNLDPAIIRAAKNLNELDTYIECLDNNQLSKFNAFKIKYKRLKNNKK